MGVDAEPGEVVVADRGEEELRGLAVGGQTADARHHAEDVRERRRAALQVVERVERERGTGIRRCRRLASVRRWTTSCSALRDVERTQRQVDQAEQRGVRARGRSRA